MGTKRFTQAPTFTMELLRSNTLLPEAPVWLICSVCCSLAVRGVACTHPCPYIEVLQALLWSTVDLAQPCISLRSHRSHYLL